MLLLIIPLLFPSSPLLQKDTAKIDLPPLYKDSEAYEVYSAILPLEWPWRGANAKSLVIRDETTSYEMCLRPEAEREDLIGPAISAYVKLNKQKWRLTHEFPIKKMYSLITSDELESARKEGGWENFYKRYPDSGGYIAVSAVGFNADKTVAVVYAAHYCGNSCGGGQFHVLHKKKMGSGCHSNGRGQAARGNREQGSLRCSGTLFLVVLGTYRELLLIMRFASK